MVGRVGEGYGRGREGKGMVGLVSLEWGREEYGRGRVGYGMGMVGVGYGRGLVG